MSENMEAFRSLDGSEGTINKPYINIQFQRGSVRELGVNGCRIEDVIEVMQNRLLDHQGRGLACEENAEALYHLEMAREALVLRRRRREEQGVFDTTKRHISAATQAVVAGD
jgi:hypothetical protein